MREVGDVSFLHRLPGQSQVLWPLPPKAAQASPALLMREPSHQYRLGDREREDLLTILGNQRHSSCDGILAHSFKLPPEKFHLACLRPQNLGQQFEQGSFPGTVGPDDPEDLPSPDVTRQALERP